MHPVFQIMILQIKTTTHIVVSEMTNGGVLLRTNSLGVLNIIILS